MTIISKYSIIFFCIYWLIAGVRDTVCSQSPDVSEAGQRIHQYTFYSRALQKDVDYSIYIPAGQPPADDWPLLMLLHGRGRNFRSVVDDSILKQAIIKRLYVIVCPNGDDGWYIDSPVIPGSMYHSMLLELLRTIRGNFPVSTSPAKTGICGWSMGGFGAMYFAANSDQADVVASTIGLLDYPNPDLPPEHNYRNGKDVPTVFGADPKRWTLFNCVKQAEKFTGKQILVIAGNSAMDLHMNQNFHHRLDQLNIAHNYVQFDGGHSFKTVQATIPMILDFMDEHLLDK